FQAGQIGTGARLGVTLTPPVLALENTRQVVVLLLLGTEFDDYRSDHVDAERKHGGGTGLGTFFLEDVLLDRAPAGTAILFRPVQSQPALLVENLLPADRVFLAKAFVFLDLAGNIRGQLVFQEGADLIAESGFLSGKVNIHNVLSLF